MKTTTTTQNNYALQCCLLCRRTLTDREQHDKLELSVLKATPECRDNRDEETAPHVERYRTLLQSRAKRAERPQRIQVIRARRREERRERWLRSVKVFASSLSVGTLATGQNAGRECSHGA